MLTVGELRKLMDGLPDDALVLIDAQMSVGGLYERLGAVAPKLMGKRSRSLYYREIDPSEIEGDEDAQLMLLPRLAIAIEREYEVDEDGEDGNTNG